MDFIQGDLFDQLPETRQTCHFLGWNRPLVDLVVEHLLPAESINESPNQPTDLGDLLVIVPTLQAGRRLRESLAARTPLIPPRIVTPDFLVTRHVDNLASPTELLLAWMHSLRKIRFSDYRNLFPVDPVEPNFAWALQTASDILAMRSSLGEAGHVIQQVPTLLGNQASESARWQELAKIERATLKRIHDAGLEDPNVARHTAPEQADLPGGCTKVIVAGVPDPSPIALNCIRAIALHHEIDILIHAPTGLENEFSTWGIPLEEAWNAKTLEIPNPETTIRVLGSPEDQATETLAITSSYDEPAGYVAIGTPDEEVIPHLEKQFAEHNQSAFNPAGRSAESHEFHYLLRCLLDLLNSHAYDAFAEWIRIPHLANRLAQDSPEFSHSETLAAFDDLRAQHLPDTLKDAETFLQKSSRATPGQHALMEATRSWMKRFEDEPLAEVLPEFLALVYADHESEDNDAFTTLADAVGRFLEDIASPFAVETRQRLTNANLLELLLETLSNERLYSDRSPSDIDLQGWLELHWEDAPHIIVTGLNDGKVPDAIMADPWLPNSLRGTLGLRDNAQRLTRDAFLLASILACRAEHGHVDLLLGKASNDNEPLRPSRLLFQCPDAELPARATQLFKPVEATAEGQPPARTIAWKLQPPPLPADTKLAKRISVTQFGSYLDCPFRFYLNHGLGMEEYEGDKIELNARDFGNLCHWALEKLGLDEELRHSTNTQEIASFLADKVDAWLHGRYGRELPLPIQFQLTGAHERLAWAADIIAQDTADGWLIEGCEAKIEDFEIHGLKVAGTIDRIERHSKTGALRVLDFKTKSKPNDTIAAHIAPLRRDQSLEDFPEWQHVLGPNGKIQRWANLQLPLYVLALREKHGDSQPIEAGYFNLPKAKSACQIELWENLTEKTLASAQNCAAHVIKGIQENRFWPPTPRPAYDNFSAILFDNAESHASPPLTP